MSTRQNENTPQFSYQVEFVKDEMVYETELLKYDAVFSGYSITNSDLYKSRVFALIKAQLLANDDLNLQRKKYPTQVYLRDEEGEIDLLIHDTRGLTDEILQNIQIEHELVHDYYKNEDDWMTLIGCQKDLEDSMQEILEVYDTSHHIFELLKIKHRYLSLKSRKKVIDYLVRILYPIEGVFLKYRVNDVEHVN